MKNRYEARMYKPVGKRHFSETTVRYFKRRDTAEAWARKVLAKHPTENTKYERGNPWFVSISDTSKPAYLDSVFAPEIDVLTVGEVGWW